MFRKLAILLALFWPAIAWAGGPVQPPGPLPGAACAGGNSVTQYPGYGQALTCGTALASGAINNGTVGQIGIYAGTNTIGPTTTGTGVVTALGVNTGSAGAFVVNGGALGTPSSGTLTNATGLPISTGLTGAGTGVLTALGVNVGSAGAFVVNGGALGTPSSGVATNLTGLPISTGLTGAGTGVLTALGVNVGTAGSFVVNGGALGTPSSGVATNLTGLPLTTGVTGILPVANGGSGSASPSLVAGSNITITGSWPNQTVTGAGSPATGSSASAGWIAASNPNLAPVVTVPSNSTVTSIEGRVMAAVGATATIDVYKAASGTACASGTKLNTTSFNANGTANTNQVLGNASTTLLAHDTICFVTANGAAFTAGTGIGGITINYTTP